ncbi:AMP-binding protein [Rhodococcus opacus]|jgi:crotonobetaine/carnitine-CoA ligase|uniref:AMP-binding protein n=1 Tax=Rhodococcus opacus TaxID=37919 RepID=UPI002473F4D2|nr:AMP-binding protein [Rhodococcus opacus]MDH6291257.1 crotonobetaine/carnitine-CoA ligase [Rhodococcus opacus]
MTAATARQRDPGKPVNPDTVLGALERAVAQGPDDVFLDFSGELLTYRDIDRMSTRLAHSFAELGITQGQTVVSVLDNNADLIVIWLAVNKLGAVWVPINTAYKGEFLRHQIADAGATLAICEVQYLPALTDIAGGVPELKRILVRGGDATSNTAGVAVDTLDTFRGTNETPIPVVTRPGDISCLIYTSGTTGPSKGCIFSHNYLCNQGRQWQQFVPQPREEAVWTCLPLFHQSALGMVMSAMINRGRLAIEARFSVSTFWEEIERSGATHALIMASIFPWVAHAPDNDAMKRCIGQLRTVTGVPVTPEVRKIWQERFGVKFVNSFGYGQSEGVFIAFSPESDSAPLSSCGHIADEDFDVRIFDNDDVEVPPGEVGEIVYRPKAPNTMFSGFWRRPDATAEVWRNLWMHTGDLGRIEDGYLYFVDRKKDYLRSRGENISSFEVERTLLSHSAISEAAVHSVQTGRGEDCMKATIVLKEGVSLTEEELCRWSIDHLPYFAVPRYVEFRSTLARTPNGKIQKYHLRAEGVTATTWDREAAGIVVRRR